MTINYTHYLYATWIRMKNRCHNPKDSSYHKYGARGIKVYPEWLGTQGLQKFVTYIIQELGDRPKGTTLDRIDPLSGYEPGNLRWATASQQCLNRQSNRNSTSKYKGVSWDSQTKKWRVQVHYQGKWVFRKRVDSEIEAAKLYNEKMRECYGEDFYANPV